MTCRAQAFRHHALDLSQTTPLGFAPCLLCEGYFTAEQWAEWRCDGAPVDALRPPVRVPVSPGAVPCALCGTPILIAALHRDAVEMYGTTCAACFYGTAPCECDHGEASHRHLENCTHEDCPCRCYYPKEEART